MKLRLPGVLRRFALIVAPVLPDFASVVATGIENPTFELVRPDTYDTTSSLHPKSDRSRSPRVPSRTASIPNNVCISRSSRKDSMERQK